MKEERLGCRCRSVGRFVVVGRTAETFFFAHLRLFPNMGFITTSFFFFFFGHLGHVGEEAIGEIEPPKKAIFAK